MINIASLQNLPSFELIGIGQRTSATLRNLRSRSHERRVNETRRQERFFVGLLKTGQTIYIEPK